MLCVCLAVPAGSQASGVGEGRRKSGALDFWSGLCAGHWRTFQTTGRQRERVTNVTLARSTLKNVAHEKTAMVPGAKRSIMGQLVNSLGKKYDVRPFCTLCI